MRYSVDSIRVVPGAHKAIVFSILPIGGSRSGATRMLSRVAFFCGLSGNAK